MNNLHIIYIFQITQHRLKLKKQRDIFFSKNLDEWSIKIEYEMHFLYREMIAEIHFYSVPLWVRGPQC